MNNKLQGKDLINIGIFTAIYFIVIFAAASIGFIPIFIPLISVIVPLVGGIPMMLFFSKIKKFGMLTICGVLLGIIMLLTGMGWWCIPYRADLRPDFRFYDESLRLQERQARSADPRRFFHVGNRGVYSHRCDAGRLLPEPAPRLWSGICRHAHGLYARLDFAGTAYCCFRQWSCRRPDWTKDFQKAL